VRTPLTDIITSEGWASTTEDFDRSGSSETRNTEVEMSLLNMRSYRLAEREEQNSADGW